MLTQLEMLLYISSPYLNEAVNLGLVASLQEFLQSQHWVSTVCFTAFESCYDFISVLFFWFFRINDSDTFSADN